MSTSPKKRLVVVGNGMVGHRFLELVRDSGLTREYDIVAIGEESRPAYDRVNLSKLFAGTSEEELSLVEPGAYENSGIVLGLGDQVVSIDRVLRQIRTAAGDAFSYDTLVLATGSRPFVPELPGRDRDGCFVYRTLDDLYAIRKAAAGRRRGAVIGGGLLGLEAANALLSLGLETHVVEAQPRLMPLQLDDPGAALLRARVEALGVHVHTGKLTGAIHGDDGSVSLIEFSDGGTLDVDLVVFSAGIRPRDELAGQAGLLLGERGGVVVDESCRTSDEHIFAIGECAVRDGRIYGLAAPGYRMAEVAASVVAGEAARFDGADMSTKLKLLGCDVGSFGDAFAATPGARTISVFDSVQGTYKKLVVSEDRRRLLGGMLVGDASAYTALLAYVQAEIALPEHPEDLIIPLRDGAAGRGLGPASLPDAALICTCHNVPKGAICEAIREQKLTALSSVKSCTKAGTGCGSCATLVGELLKVELKRAGVAVSNRLCEHFAMSRQELFHLLRVERIRTFQELLARHGTGAGCEICKPAVASMLASTVNDYVLKDEHLGLQDTNDRYLANIQRDGTYSVVPRLAAGEVTPDQLIALGTIAKKYGLYTKITGGQRVDMFGARLEQLPLIWRELVDAGFESGHAYGKALRTVKSCVGSTWCRYGVQDSVGLALRIENRYKGMRSPHKLKGAVSGCARECAEAQGKDFGVIATDKGYNLYLCGNGGMKPQHAVLFAADLDEDTVIRYLDRFFVFYIRTADRLERTAKWFNGLEGGIEYLRRVLIDDCLGICADLEAQMAHLVATYQCEWKTTVESPERLKLFRAFVNSPEPDPSIVRVPERGQFRPAFWAEKRPFVESGKIRLPVIQHAT